jgi:hypothetical protein
VHTFYVSRREGDVLEDHSASIFRVESQLDLPFVSAGSFKNYTEYLEVPISLWLFLFRIFLFVSTAKRIYLGWVKEARTTKP